MRDWTLTAEPDQDETETQIEFDQITGDWEHEDDTITNTDHITNIDEALQHHLAGKYAQLNDAQRSELKSRFIAIVNESTWVSVSPATEEIHITYSDEDDHIDALADAEYQITSPESGQKNAQRALNELDK